MATGQLQNGGGLPVHFSRETYISKLLRYRLTPIFISSITPKNVADELYRECGGVLCMGGGDFDPKLYGESAHPKTWISEPVRDQLEIYVIRKALADKKPYLGICRGAQGLAVAAGGNLHQHILDLAPDERHWNEGLTYNGIHANRHPIFISPDSKAYELLGKESAMVNCGHHQSVNNPGTGLLISGKSPAGIVEIIESEDPGHFCFGLQSHPETEDAGNFEAFFAAFEKSINIFGSK